MNINDNYFKGVYQHTWKKIIPPGLTEAETDLLMEAGALREGSKVLDLMCGYGRHALELGRRGVSVRAIDNLQAYVDEINAAATAENLPVQAACADVLSASFEEVYDAVICMGNSFAFFNGEDLGALLKNIAAHLKPGGLLVINSWMIAEISIRHFKDKEWYDAGGYKCLLDNQFLFQPSRIESQQTIISPDGSMEVIDGVDYIYTINELEALFTDAGLNLKTLYSTPRKRRFSLGDTQVYILVERNHGGSVDREIHRD